MHSYPLTILEHHLDTFGHVNNATYLEILEEARWDLITRNGYGLREIQAQQKGPIILQVTLRYLKEIRLRQEIDILTWCPQFEGRVGKIFQKMVDRGNSTTIYCEAEFTFALFDIQKRKIISPTSEWLKAIGQ